MFLPFTGMTILLMTHDGSGFSALANKWGLLAGDAGNGKTISDDDIFAAADSACGPRSLAAFLRTVYIEEQSISYIDPRDCNRFPIRVPVQGYGGCLCAIRNKRPIWTFWRGCTNPTAAIYSYGHT